ncbi:MAG: hypothetical protein ACP5NY_04860 [Thermocladium sp.]
MSGPSQPQNPALGSIRTELLVGLIFAILALLVFIIAAIVYFAEVAIISSMAPYGAAVAAGYLIGAGIIFLIMFAVSIIVTIRIYRMYKAANSGDIASLKSMNSLGWAIIALIFSGLIPGIMLLIAHGPIQQL